MASRIVLKQLRSNVLRSSFRPAMATGVVDRFSFTRKMHHDQSVSLTTKETVPRSFKREDAQNIFLFIDMPGIPKKDVNVKVDNRYGYGYFSVKGQVPKDYECECRKYNASFYFPGNIDRSRIKANMKDGVLKVTLPKTKETEQDEDDDVDVDEDEDEETMNEFKIMVN